MPYFEHNARCYCDLQNMNVWDVRSAEKVRSKEGDRKSPDVANWAADPFLCDAAVAAVPQRFCPEHIMVIAKVAIPSRDASGIEKAGRPTVCSLGWFSVGRRPANPMLPYNHHYESITKCGSMKR